MKIDLSNPVKDLFGNPLRSSVLENGAPDVASDPVMLSTVVVNALLSPTRGGLEPSASLACFTLAQKVASGSAEYTVEDGALIKLRAGLAYAGSSPLIYGRIVEAVEAAA